MNVRRWRDCLNELAYILLFRGMYLMSGTGSFQRRDVRSQLHLLAYFRDAEVALDRASVVVG